MRLWAHLAAVAVMTLTVVIAVSGDIALALLMAAVFGWLSRRLH